MLCGEFVDAESVGAGVRLRPFDPVPVDAPGLSGLRGRRHAPAAAPNDVAAAPHA